MKWVIEPSKYLDGISYKWKLKRNGKPKMKIILTDTGKEPTFTGPISNKESGILSFLK